MTIEPRFSFDRRRGVSMPELFGCLVALVAGAVIGALYLGVDVRAMTLGAFEGGDAEVSQSSPDGEVATDGKVATTDGVQPAPLAAGEPASAGPSETAAVETVANARPASNGSADNKPLRVAPSVVAEESDADLASEGGEIQDITNRYWHDLTVAMQTESKERNAVKGSGEDWQLFDHLSHRRDKHKTAVAALEKLESRGVDSRVVEFSERATEWHDAGVSLYGRAVDLLTDGPAAQLSGPYAQSWQSAATQHRMEERLLLERQRAVHQYLRHRQSAPAQ
ncbi:hypothetical protein OAS39_01135 [Pirellulales bacterium]|nr:hypothetical protein [Pirellulales bacterium]